MTEWDIACADYPSKKKKKLLRKNKEYICIDWHHMLVMRILDSQGHTAKVVTFPNFFFSK